MSEDLVLADKPIGPPRQCRRYFHAHENPHAGWSTVGVILAKGINY
jgi:hypothetical protein